MTKMPDEFKKFWFKPKVYPIKKRTDQQKDQTFYSSDWKSLITAIQQATKDHWKL